MPFPIGFPNGVPPGLPQAQTHDHEVACKGDTHPGLQAGKKGKMGVLCSPPSGSPQLETPAPGLLSCLQSLHSVPVRV